MRDETVPDHLRRAARSVRVLLKPAASDRTVDLQNSFDEAAARKYKLETETDVLFQARAMASVCAGGHLAWPAPPGRGVGTGDPVGRRHWAGGAGTGVGWVGSIGPGARRPVVPPGPRTTQPNRAPTALAS